IFSNAETSLRYTVHPRIVFETAAVKAARPDSDFDITALTSRIKTLEDKLKEIEEKGVAVKEEKKDTVIEKQDTEKQLKTQASTYNNIDKNKTENDSDKVSVGQINPDELKGKILFFLRSEKKEMLHNVIEEARVSANGNVITVTCLNSYDADYVNIKENVSAIKESLKDYAPCEINVVVSAKGKLKDAFEEDAERVKSIFGDDIVIIKD
ncbi:MAG: hypothetical protein J6Y43_05405, partial [Clostridia bacterium]|nr:hypothetical protein [Clostridia bacterium]